MKHRIAPVNQKSFIQTEAEGPSITTSLTDEKYTKGLIDSEDGTLPWKIERILGDEKSGIKFLMLVIAFSIVMRAAVG